MSITITCGCGNQLRVSPAQAGTAVRCPVCAAAVAVPAMGVALGASATQNQNAIAGRSRPLWPWVAAGVAVILFLGIGLFLLNRNGPKKPRRLIGDDAALALADDAANEPSLEQRLPDSPSPKAIQTKDDNPKEEKPKQEPTKPLIVEVPTEKPQREKLKVDPKPDLPEKPKDAPKPQPAPPLPEIDRVEPASPRAGGPLTITLTGKDATGKPVDIEYRRRGQEEWKKADKGVVKLTDLKASPLILEFRAIDARGKPSPILSRTWKIDPAKLIAQPLQLEWKLKPGDQFFQELRVVQKPSYNIQGIPFNTVLEYVVISSFNVEKAGANGYEIQQKVEGAQLVQADALTQPLLTPAVNKLPGTTFNIHLDDKMEVKKFEAAGLPAAVMAQGAIGLQVASLLDQDGWKEMARTTFFQPNRPLKVGEKWSQPMTHTWGALGSWSGRIHYAYGGGKGALHQFAFGLDIGYQPPKGKGGAGMLAINSAAFKAQQAGGVILFDADKGKVVEARERFLVRGRLALQLLGMNTPVDLEEDQNFHLRISDINPLKK